MSRVRLRMAFCFCAMALVTSACAKSTPEARATFKPVAPRVVEPMSLPTIDDSRVTYSKNGVETSMGTGVPADFNAIGLPIYPSMKASDAFVITNVAKKSSSITIQGPVSAAVGTVVTWYAGRLGPSFKMSRLHVLGGEIASFSKGAGGNRQSILVQLQKDAKTGLLGTVVTITVTKQR